MKRITQDAHFRQRMMLYSEHHGVEETANHYRVHRKTVWKWRNRWDGTPGSLEELSRKPHHCPRAQGTKEIKLVLRMRKKYREDLLLGYQKACQYRYAHNTFFLRFIHLPGVAGINLRAS